MRGREHLEYGKEEKESYSYQLKTDYYLEIY